MDTTELAIESSKVKGQDRYDEDPVDVDLMVNGLDSYEWDSSY